MGVRDNSAAYERARREKVNKEIARQIIEEARKIKDMGYGGIVITCEAVSEYQYNARKQYGGM